MVTEDDVTLGESEIGAAIANRTFSIRIRRADKI